MTRPRPSDPIEKRLPFACNHCKRRFATTHALKMHAEAAHKAIGYCKRPCAECPCRLDVAPGKFPPERFIALAANAYDLALTIFACHMSGEAVPLACAGYVLQQSAHNLTMRLARQSFDVASDAPLYRTYREMAIANGVAEDDPCLRPCRDDGQTRRDPE